MFFTDPFYFSVLIQKLIVKMMRHGQRSQAEILFFSMCYSIKTFYFLEPAVLFYKIILRPRSPFLIRQVRIGARKYTVLSPAPLATQLGLSTSWLVRSFAAKNGSYPLLLLTFWLEFLFLNKYNPRFVGTSAEARFNQERAGVEYRHLQHYRWN